MVRRRIVVPGLIAALAVSVSGSPAIGDHLPGEGPRAPLVVAQHIAAVPSQVANATYASNGLAESSHAAIMAFLSPVAEFPRDGNGFGLIGSGDTNVFNDPNVSLSTSTGDDGGFQLSGMNTNQGTDLAGLNIDLNVPGVASPCLQVDLKFFSEEFPEFVGSAFNDFAVAQVNNTTPPTIDGVGNVVSTGNFLLDGFGNQLTINNNFLIDLLNAAGTTYDGATPVLRAQTPLVPGQAAQTVSFFVGDVGDSIYDTMLFLDRLIIVDQPNCQTATVGPSFIENVKTKVKGSNVVASGQILPPAPGQPVFLTLFAKTGGGFNATFLKKAKFKKVAKKKATLKADSTYKRKLKLPKSATKCKLKVVYKGDAAHDPSKTVKKFKC